MEFAPIPLPSPNTSPVIAPLWIMPTQTVRLIRITNNLYYRVTNQSATLSEITTLITESNQNLVEFQPRMAVVVTLFLNSPDSSRGTREQLNLGVRISTLTFRMAASILRGLI